MQNYQIEQSKDEKFSVIIFSLNLTGPFNDLVKLNKDLIWSGAEDLVLFDLLLSNGKGYNRYSSMKFNGSSLNMKSLKIETKISEVIKMQSLEFFKTNSQLQFNKSILNVSDIDSLNNSFKKLG